MSISKGKFVKSVAAAAASLFAFAGTTFADTWEDPETHYVWTYGIDDGEAEIYNASETAVDPKPTGLVWVPTTLGGSPVTRIGDYAFQDCNLMTRVTIPDGVKEIGAGAFSGCSSLAGVVIPDSVTEIESGAFYGCKALADANGFAIIRNVLYAYAGSAANVAIPAGVTAISNGAFEDCDAVTSVTIPDGVALIDDYAFSGCTELVSVTIPASVREIGAWAFRSCVKLELAVPDTVTEIENGAFYKCDKLADAKGFVIVRNALHYYNGFDTDVSIPPGITAIGGNAFMNATSVKSVTIPYGVQEIGNRAFVKCNSLTDVEIPESVEHIGLNAFGETKLATVYVVPDDTARVRNLLAKSRFSGADTLTFKEDVTPHPEYTTENVGGIEWKYHVVAGGAEIYNDDYAAIPDTTVGDIVVPSTLGGFPVVGIGDYAFEECDAITSIVIPASVRTIGSYAFNGCDALATVTLSEGLVEIGDDAFEDCAALSSISIPSTVTDIGEGAFYGCAALADVSGFVIVRNVLYGYFGSDADVTVPVGVRVIDYCAFEDCDTVMSVTIPDGVQEIGDWAFDDCDNLASVSIPDSVTDIGAGAFRKCPALADANGFVIVRNVLYGYAGSDADVTVPAGVTALSAYAFAWDSTLKSVSVPYGVVTIGSSAFALCDSLESVSIQSSVMRINMGAFRDCSALASVHVAPDDSARVLAMIEGSGFTGSLAYYEDLPTVVFCTVTFDANSGSASESFRIVASGNPVGKLPTASRSGDWEFAGWFTESVDGDPVTDATTVSGDVTYYAHWKEIVYTYYKWEDPATHLEWTYLINGGEAEIHKTGECAVSPMPEGHVVIPATLGGCPVTKIGVDAFYWCDQMTGVTIPSTVTEIDDKAFESCGVLAGVDIPAGVTRIGKSAFRGCTSLTQESVKIPSSVTYIGDRAFEGCYNMRDEDGLVIVRDVLYDCIFPPENLTIPSGVTTISSFATTSFAIRSLTIPPTVTELRPDSFYNAGAGNLTTIYYLPGDSESRVRALFTPETLADVGSLTFLEKTDYVVTFDPDGGTCGTASVTKKHAEAVGALPSAEKSGFVFVGWFTESGTYGEQITSATKIKDNVTFYAHWDTRDPGTGAYVDGDGFTWEYTVEDGKATVWNVNPKKPLVDAAVPSVLDGYPVTKLGSWLFQWCTSLRRATVPSGVTAIGGNAFYDLPALEEVVVPASVTSFGSSAFAGCTSLAAATIPSGVTSISASLFQDCAAITEVVIPRGVTYIAGSAFCGCSSLATLTIPRSVAWGSAEAFAGTALKKVYVDNGDTDRVKALLADGGFTDFTGVEFVESPADSYIVEFDMNGGSWATESWREVAHGAAIGTLPDAVSGGLLQFAGWFTEKISGEQITMETKITANVTYYAHWKEPEAPTYTISLDANGGSVSPDYVERKADEEVGTLPVPERSGWQFDGWFTAAEGGEKVSASTKVNGNFTYYAQWTASGYSSWIDASGVKWTYRIVDGHAEIYNDGNTAIPSSTSGTVIVPSVIGGYTVTAIGSGAFEHCNIEGVVIPDTVTSIGHSAFFQCWRLASATVPDSVVEIDENAFYDCGSLADANGYVIIHDILFCYCGSDVDVTVPSGVTRVDGGAFASLQATLQSVTLPSGVTSIGSYAFDSFTALNYMVIPKSVVTMGFNAFNGCTALARVYVASGDTARMRELIRGAGLGSAADSITFEEEPPPPPTYTVTLDANGGSVSPDYVERKEGEEVGTLPVPVLSGWTFKGWFTAYLGGEPVAETETVSGDVTYYAHWVPEGYDSWIDASGVEWIFRIVGGEAEIYNNDQPVIPTATAGNIVVPSTLGGCPVTRIGYNAFGGCDAVTGVTIPSGVASIGDYAFNGCTSMAYVTIPESVTDIGDCAFTDCAALADENGFTIVRNVFYGYFGAASVVTIPSGVTYISDDAFYGCYFVTSVTIPQTVKGIGWSVFNGCTVLQEIRIPYGVESLGNYVFEDCASLAEMSIPKSVTEIGDNAFKGCASLAKVKVGSGDTARIKGLMEGSGFDTTGVNFEEEALCTVTLELNGGSGIETSFQCEPGTKIGVLPIPEGYADGAFKYENFKGWFWDAGFTIEVDPSDEVWSDCTCYAQWGLAADLQTAVVDGIKWSYYVSGANKITLYNNGRSVIPDDYKGALTIPARIANKTVAGIGTRAFCGCTGLTSVVIPDGVEDVAEKAFAWCENLQAVQLGKGTANGTIFYQAFKGCVRLRALDFKAAKPVYAVEDAFEDAGTLTGEGKPCVYVPKSAARAWGDAWMGMRVLPYPFQVQFTMGIMPGKASYGTVTPIPYGPATEIGKKVTLKAKANKTYVFAGWYDCDWNDSENPAKQVLFSRASSYSYTVTGEFKHFKADFVKEEEDIASLAINVTDVTTALDGTAAIDIGAAVASCSEPKIALKGLPAGLKYDSKTMTVTGKATKPGIYNVTVSATNASVKKAKTAEFTITVPNFTDPLITLPYEYYGPFTPGESYLANIPGAAGCTVSGLPAGLKWTDKNINDKTLGLLPGNSFYGAVTAKPGFYTVFFTKTVDKVKHTATATFEVGPLPVLAIKKAGDGTGKVTGAGAYAAYKKVSLKATADTKDAPATAKTEATVKSVFMGWYDEYDNLISQAASYSYVMPSMDATLTARFITAAQDAAGVSAKLVGVGDFDADHLAADITLACGVYVEWPLEVAALSQTTVKVAGLPAGLKFTAIDIMKKGSKTEVEIPANTIYGAPTAQAKTDRVTGDFVPSPVKITITTAGKTVVNYTVNVLVLEKTVGSYGTYDGGGAKGQATLTIPSTGKISGKYLADGLTWTLSAPYFDSFDDGTKMYTATLEAKCGKDVVPLFLSAWRDARGIDNARVADGDGNEIATLYKDADWKTGISPWKSIAKDFAAAPEITYAATDSVAGPGFVTLKFSNNGSVTVKGEFSGYKASGSAPLLPTCLIWEFMNHDATSTAVVYVYLPPKAGKFAGHVKAVQLQWDGLRFNDVTP